MRNSIGSWHPTILSHQTGLNTCKDPKAPLVLAPPVTIPLDKLTLEFADDLIFKEGEPADLNY